MNQESRSVFSTIQQVKFTELQLEIEALEKQIADTLQIQNEYTEGVMQSSTEFIRIEELKAKTVVKL